MAKSRKTRPRRREAPSGARLRPNRFGWRAIAVLIGVLGVSIAGLAEYRQAWERSHDLTAVGNGKPTVVQIHDPGCALCRQLRANVESALDRTGSDVQYRIADISTPAGRRMQRKYQVPHVTLLLFDGGGGLVRTIQGVTSVPTLESVLGQLGGEPSGSS